MSYYGSNLFDPNEYQNESPTVREFYYFMTRYEGVFAHGYAVSPDRDDYRVSIEGLLIPREFVTDELKIEFEKLCSDADDYFTDEGLYSWWD